MAFNRARAAVLLALAASSLLVVSPSVSVVHASFIPCDSENAIVYATTTNSNIEVCTVNGSLVYQGRRLSDGSTIVLTNVTALPNAIEAYNEGLPYSLRRSGLHLINPSGVDNYEPWTSVKTWNVP